LLDRFAALIGALPPFLMLWYAERLERRVREPHARFRYRILGAVGLASIPMAWAESWVAHVISRAPEPERTLSEAFLVAAAIEETGKVLCIYILSRSILAPGTRYGGFLYALHAAAGFAIVENVMMMIDTPNLTVFTVRFVLRAYMASPMHLFAGGVVGYFWARRRFDNGAIGLSGGLGVAILIHGSYNALLLAVERFPEGYENWVIVCALTAIALPLSGLIVLRWLAGKLRDDDIRDGRAPLPVSRGRVAVP
jgi:RsiW-degrading membrane proteinase PrsW (M82 family)